MAMRTYIFLCSAQTEDECLDRMLFGSNPGLRVDVHYSNIEVGDRLFLYNYELGILRGPFTALTTCTFNLEPSAWKKSRGRFPWQVRVEEAQSPAASLGVDDFVVFIPLTQSKVGLLPPAEITDEQAERLLGRMAGQR